MLPQSDGLADKLHSRRSPHNLCDMAKLTSESCYVEHNNVSPCKYFKCAYIFVLGYETFIVQANRTKMCSCSRRFSPATHREGQLNRQAGQPIHKSCRAAHLQQGSPATHREGQPSRKAGRPTYKSCRAAKLRQDSPAIHEHCLQAHVAQYLTGKIVRALNDCCAVQPQSWFWCINVIVGLH